MATRDSKGRFIKGHGSLHTEISKQKISDALKGKNTWSKGRKLLETTKLKIKQNNAKYWLGKKRPDFKGNQFAKGQIPWNKDTKGIMPAPWNLGIVGKESHFWKEIKRTPLRLAIRQLHQYRQWRSSIFKRDNYTCVLCKKSEEVRGKLEADHYPISFATLITNINSIDEAIKCNGLWDIKNGRTLCEDCHKTTDNFMWRARMKNCIRP